MIRFSLVFAAATLAVPGLAVAEDEPEVIRVLSQAFKLVGKADEVEPAHMTLVAGSVCTGLIDGGKGVSCLSPDDVASLAQIKAIQMGTGSCDSDLDGCIDALQALGEAKYLVYGTVAEVDGKLRLEATLTDMADAKPVGKSVQTADGIESLLEAAEKAGRELAGKIAKP